MKTEIMGMGLRKYAVPSGEIEVLFSGRNCLKNGGYWGEWFVLESSTGEIFHCSNRSPYNEEGTELEVTKISLAQLLAALHRLPFGPQPTPIYSHNRPRMHGIVDRRTWPAERAKLAERFGVEAFREAEYQIAATAADSIDRKDRDYIEVGNLYCGDRDDWATSLLIRAIEWVRLVAPLPPLPRW